VFSRALQLCRDDEAAGGGGGTYDTRRWADKSCHGVSSKQTNHGESAQFCRQQQFLEVVGRSLRELSQSSFGFREWLGSSLSSKQIPKCPRESANLNGASGGGWMWGGG